MKGWTDLFPRLTPEEEAAIDARAQADIATGRVVDHAKVVEWLKTWGTPEERPVPSEWLV